MKALASFVAIGLATTTSLAHADDPGMQLMMIMMRCPAISADGKHVAIYSQDPGAERGAMTSLVVFDTTGKVEQRISVTPPVTDVAKAKAAAGKLAKLLDDGGYKRMSRVAQSNTNTKTLAPVLSLTSEDVAIEMHVKGRKVTLDATRAGKKLATITRALPAKDGPCKKPDAYSIANTQAGYDAKTQQFAFSVGAEENNEMCFGHDFVVTLK